MFGAFCIGWSMDTFVELNATTTTTMDATGSLVEPASGHAPTGTATLPVTPSSSPGGGPGPGSAAESTGRGHGVIQNPDSDSQAGHAAAGGGLRGPAAVGGVTASPDSANLKGASNVTVHSAGSGSLSWSETDHMATWPPGFPQVMPRDPRVLVAPKRGCITTDATGEGCYFHDAMVCVGLHSQSLVGIVVEEGDELLAHPELVDRRLPGFQTSGEASLPKGFVSGLRSTPKPYIGTNPAKR